MNGSVFIATSLDGFIARADGAIDWLPHDSTEDYGYDTFMASVDAVVMGRLSYETVLGMGGWFYGTKPVYVLSSLATIPRAPEGATVARLAGAPEEVAAELERRGVREAYIDGGVTIQRFLRAGLIRRVIITRIPVLLGTGRPLFGELQADIRLKHLRTQSWPSGLVQSEYRIGD